MRIMTKETQLKRKLKGLTSMMEGILGNYFRVKNYTGAIDHLYDAVDKVNMENFATIHPVLNPVSPAKKSELRGEGRKISRQEPQNN